MDDQMEPIRAGETLSAARSAPSWVVVLSALLVAFAASRAGSGTGARSAGGRAPGNRCGAGAAANPRLHRG